jgi:hypothetical protein
MAGKISCPAASSGAYKRWTKSNQNVEFCSRSIPRSEMINKNELKYFNQYHPFFYSTHCHFFLPGTS